MAFTDSFWIVSEDTAVLTVAAFGRLKSETLHFVKLGVHEANNYLFSFRLLWHVDRIRNFTFGAFYAQN